MNPFRTTQGLTLLTVALAVGLVAVPLAGAQDNPTRPVIQVQIDGQPSTQIVTKSGGTLRYEFTVSFRCEPAPGQAGPCEGQLGDTRVDVTITETHTYPQGWEVELGPLSFSMQARETRVVPVTVRLLDDEPEESRFTIGLRASARPVIETPLGISGLLTENFNQQSQATDDVSAEERLTTAEQLVGLARDYMWPLVGAAMVLLISGIVLVERRRGAIVVESDQAEQQVLPGRGASFPVRIKNDTRDDERVQLRASNLPPGWDLIQPLDEIDLNAGRDELLYISLRAPPTARPGESVRFEFRARTTRGTVREGEAELRAVVADDPYAVGFQESVPPAVPGPGAAAPPMSAPPRVKVDPPEPEPLAPAELEDFGFSEDVPAERPRKAATKKKRAPSRRGGAKRR